MVTPDRYTATNGSPDSLHRCEKALIENSNGANQSPKFRTSLRSKMRRLQYSVLRQGRYCKKSDYAITDISDLYNDPTEPDSSPSTSSSSESPPKQFTETVIDTPPDHARRSKIDKRDRKTRHKRNSSIPSVKTVHDQSEQIQNVSPTSLKSSIDELFLSSQDLGIPKLSDSGTSIMTPVCYQMTTMNNPFVLKQHDVDVAAVPLTGNDTPTTKKDTTSGSNDDNLHTSSCIDSVSSVSSVSSMSNNSARTSCHHQQQEELQMPPQQPQPHIDPIHYTSVFQSFEIRCRMNHHHKRMTTTTTTTTTNRNHHRKLYFV